MRTLHIPKLVGAFNHLAGLKLEGLLFDKMVETVELNGVVERADWAKAQDQINEAKQKS